jgi:hypothetical protein
MRINYLSYNFVLAFKYEVDHEIIHVALFREMMKFSKHTKH